MIERTQRDRIAFLEISHGKVNAIDLELATAFCEVLAAEREQPSRAVVITGRGKAFSAGVDLHRVVDGGDEYLRQFIPALVGAFEALATFPRPVVAAVNGHAIAGGAVLLFACDYRVMARGPARIGLPELQVGVPFPDVAFDIVRSAIAPQYLREVIYSGRAYRTEEALQRGFFDELVDPADLPDRSFQMAHQLAGIPAEAFRISKEQLLSGRAAAGDARIEQVWRSPATRDAMRSYIRKTLGC